MCGHRAVSNPDIIQCRGSFRLLSEATFYSKVIKNLCGFVCKWMDPRSVRVCTYMWCRLPMHETLEMWVRMPTMRFKPIFTWRSLPEFHCRSTSFNFLHQSKWTLDPRTCKYKAVTPLPAAKFTCMHLNICMVFVCRVNEKNSQIWLRWMG